MEKDCIYECNKCSLYEIDPCKQNHHDNEYACSCACPTLTAQFFSKFDMNIIDTNAYAHDEKLTKNAPLIIWVLESSDPITEKFTGNDIGPLVGGVDQANQYLDLLNCSNTPVALKKGIAQARDIAISLSDESYRRWIWLQNRLHQKLMMHDFSLKAV